MWSQRAHNHANINIPAFSFSFSFFLFWGLQVSSSYSIWGWFLKGWFERGILWRAKLRLKCIEDFNLEHCPWPLCCKISYWSKRPRLVQVHSILEGEGLRVQKRFSWVKSLHGFLRGRPMTMLHGLPGFATCPPPRDWRPVSIALLDLLLCEKATTKKQWVPTLVATNGPCL